jgi:ribosomal protein S18 acetylase RimI-like enzyme
VPDSEDVMLGAGLPADHYWKTPFVWEPGCPTPPTADGVLAYEPAHDDWLRDAIAQVMSHSRDESDQVAVQRLGALRAASDVLSLSQDFVIRQDWWRRARNEAGEIVGFVLPALFHDEESVRDGRPEGTIFYMGVLPAHRGQGHATRLVAEATRILVGASCWRILCDTGSTNLPMINAFRRAGYIERPPWPRPLH